MTPPRASAIGTKAVREIVTVGGETDHIWVRQVEDKHAEGLAKAVFEALQNGILFAIKRLFFRNRLELARRQGVPTLEGPAIEQMASERVERRGSQIGHDVRDILVRVQDGSFELPVGTYSRRYAAQVAAEEGLPVTEDADEQEGERGTSVTVQASFDRR